MAVCTSAVLLSMTGLLQGRKATTNKLEFTATVPPAPGVERVKQARWVADGNFFTSSDVSAGVDTALAVIANPYGMQVARDLAQGARILGATTRTGTRSRFLQGWSEGGVACSRERIDRRRGPGKGDPPCRQKGRNCDHH